MDASIISAMAAVLGSLTGGLATFATAWVTQRASTKREIIRLEIRKREALYGRFISECSRLFVDSLVNKLDKPEAMLPVYALLNRIRVSASDVVLTEAERLLKRITEQYFSPNLSVEDLHTLVNAGSDVDPLKPLGNACRAELKSMRSAV